jgi:hypothetical protein
MLHQLNELVRELCKIPPVAWVALVALANAMVLGLALWLLKLWFLNLTL